MESENANEEQAKLRISEFNKVDTALVDKIYSLARLEVLDNIKSEILKWMAVLSLLLTGLAIFGINSVIQYSVEKAVQSELEKHRKEVEQLMVSTKLNEEKIATDVKQINKMRSAFTEDKEALETSLNQIDGIKEKLNSTIAEGQTLELALRKAMSELHRIRSLTAVVTLTFERDISELTAEAFADIRVGNINMGTAPGLVESNVKQAQIALWHLGADSQDDDEMVALFVSVLDLICTKIIYHFILT